MQYKVIEEFHLGSLENEVNKLLKENWELVGGLSTAYNRTNHCYFYTQAMIRKK